MKTRTITGTASALVATAALMLTGCTDKEPNPKPYPIEVKMPDGETRTCFVVDDQETVGQIEDLDCDEPTTK